MRLKSTWKSRIEQRLEKLESEAQCTKGFHTWITDNSVFHPRIICGWCKKYHTPEKQELPGQGNIP